MKISTFVFMIIIPGLVFYIFGLMINESQTNYDIQINSSNLDGRYDFVNATNEEINPIKESLSTISDEDKGWLERIGSGFTGLIAAVTFLPLMVLNIGTMGGNMISGFAQSLGIPGYIILTMTIMLTIWGVFKLIEFYQRWNV